MTPDEIHQLGLNEVARLTAKEWKSKKRGIWRNTFRVFRICTNKPESKPFKKPEEVMQIFWTNLWCYQA
jgi:uncharacterized protein (DUF885 family)